MFSSSLADALGRVSLWRFALVLLGLTVGALLADVPHSRPVQIIGTMELNANPTNFFAETEQVAFHPGHLVPGIDVTDDPLLQGRLFSYLDTQLTRLGGPNFGQIPINRPHAPVNDMLRDGFHQHAVHKGVAPYKPNSLDGGCPFFAGADEGAFIDFPVELPAAQKERALSRSFDDHYSQVRQFYKSLSEIEKEHVAYAYTFELGKCYEQTIKERQLQILANIDADLCATVAAGLGLEAPAPTIELVDPAPSPALSQVGKTWPVQGRIIGVVADDTSDLDQVQAAVKAIDGADCVPLVIAPHGGKLGGVVPVSRTFLTARSVEFDAVLFATPAPDPRARLLVDETLRHQKAVAAWGDGRALFEGVAAPGVVSATGPEDAVSAVLELLGTHRVWERTAM